MTEARAWTLWGAIALAAATLPGCPKSDKDKNDPSAAGTGSAAATATGGRRVPLPTLGSGTASSLVDPVRVPTSEQALPGQDNATVIPPQILPELGSFSFSTIPERYAEDVPQGKWPKVQGLPFATNCPAFLMYTRRNDIVLPAPVKQNKEYFGFSAVRCTALEWLQSASGAKRSWVRDFTLTPESTRMLPGAFASAWSPAGKLIARPGDTYTWTAHYPKLTAKSESATRVLVNEDPESQVRATFWALVDINNDGLEDLLFYVVNSTKSGENAIHRLLAITRDSPSKPFRVVRQYPEPVI